jgi:hypothetical protein
MQVLAGRVHRGLTKTPKPPCGKRDFLMTRNELKKEAMAWRMDGMG